MSFSAKPLDATTWPGFAALVERHNGVWGGCWCMAFHAKGTGAAGNRAAKEALVREGRAHAALVFDGPACVGWCQFGPTQELPRIKHRHAYEEGLTTLPDWRITCFFSDKSYRGKGGGVGRTCRRAGRNRPPRRRHGGKLSRGCRRAFGRRRLPAQRHAGHVRAARFSARPPDRQAPLGGRKGCEAARRLRFKYEQILIY